MTREKRQEREVAGRIKLRPMACAHTAIGVDGLELDGGVRPRFELHVRTEADGRIERRRAVVKEVQGPDIDGSTRQIDAGGRR